MLLGDTSQYVISILILGHLLHPVFRYCVHVEVYCSSMFVSFVQGAMAATYRAMSQSPRPPHLMPVFTSELAQRRWRKSRPKSSTEV